MKIQDIVREAAETIRGIEYLAGVPVIEIEKGDVENELEIGVSKSNAAVLVGWTGFTPTIQGETAPGGLIGKTTLSVSVFECPVTNRITTGAPTILNMAQEIANTLHCAIAEGMDAPLYLKRITPVSELADENNSGVVTCDVEFETTARL